jgi:hypothetical protein
MSNGVLSGLRRALGASDDTLAIRAVVAAAIRGGHWAVDRRGCEGLFGV